MMHCKTCRYWQPPEATRINGQCRIRSVPGDWPRRQPDDWCGEHEARLAPAVADAHAKLLRQDRRATEEQEARQW